MKIKLEEISQEKMFEAIKLGVKEAIHEMMETGDGYNGIIIRDIVLGEIQEGIFKAMRESTPLLSDVEKNIKDGIREAMPHSDDILDAIHRGCALGVSGQ